MSADRQPDSDPLEMAIQAFQQLPVPERPRDAEVLARLGPGRTFVPFRRRSRVRLIASAAAVVLLLGGLVLILPNRRPPDAETRLLDLGEHEGGRSPGPASLADTAPSPAVRPPERKESVMSLPVVRLEETVKESQVIVVATAESSAPAPPSEGDARDVLIQFKVKRILKGELKHKTITTRTGAPAEKIVGQDWIVCLSPRYVAGKEQSAPLTSAEFEARFKQIILSEETK
jgi:hypothetical protein